MHCVTGIHYIGEMDGKSWTHVLVDQLTEGQLDWVPMDQEYDVVCGRNIEFTINNAHIFMCKIVSI